MEWSLGVVVKDGVISQGEVLEGQDVQLWSSEKTSYVSYCTSHLYSQTLRFSQPARSLVQPGDWFDPRPLTQTEDSSPMAQGRGQDRTTATGYGHRTVTRTLRVGADPSLQSFCEQVPPKRGGGGCHGQRLCWHMVLRAETIS